MQKSLYCIIACLSMSKVRSLAMDESHELFGNPRCLMITSFQRTSELYPSQLFSMIYDLSEKIKKDKPVDMRKLERLVVRQVILSSQQLVRQASVAKKEGTDTIPFSEYNC